MGLAVAVDRAVVQYGAVIGWAGEGPALHLALSMAAHDLAEPSLVPPPPSSPHRMFR